TWNRTIDVNATGTMLAIKQALPQMIEQANGSIITLSSPTALTGRGWRYPAYSASKGAVMALTRAVALAHARQGIRANCVVPGPIQTEMTDDIFDQHGEEILARIPIGRFGQPTDLQGVMVFLASKASAYITGSIITVDGGLLAD
ncbi:MAG: SDR family NAD(P)-dependent oxidoreductase, partial [Acidimicrobiia bacterium]